MRVDVLLPSCHSGSDRTRAFVTGKWLEYRCLRWSSVAILNAVREEEKEADAATAVSFLACGVRVGRQAPEKISRVGELRTVACCAVSKGTPTRAVCNRSLVLCGVCPFTRNPKGSSFPSPLPPSPSHSPRELFVACIRSAFDRVVKTQLPRNTPN